MKLVILAGGYGTRLSEETKIKPKPLVKIGKKPIIWHLMKIYSSFGINEFIICLGYKGHIIKNELKGYIKKENWVINFVDTGLHTMTGGRVKQIKKYLGTEKNFCLSYGDGLSNINIKKLIKFHLNSNKIATLTAVKYKNPKGVLLINKNFKINKIKEKPVEYINGGFFVLSQKIFKFLKNNKTIFEKDCLPLLAKKNQLLAFKHNGFWACMDTLREKKELNTLWKQKNCKWKVW
ncbi:sugar phosphate nucleotidyltransferase [Candidatus Pelagibacter sp.]|jgi:glucose-1-phosphate cytidylyltransferase|nr:sugar phosphate nucleotidyltransferase [Candidatus Pelagibacter sp.]